MRIFLSFGTPSGFFGASLAIGGLSLAFLLGGLSQQALAQTDPESFHPPLTPKEQSELNGVLGNDQRNSLQTPSSRPSPLQNNKRFFQKSIGLISTSSHSCSGTLIGNQLVATAAHCLIEASDHHRKYLENVQFLHRFGVDAVRSEGEAAAQSYPLQAYCSGRFDLTPSRNRIRNDWAIALIEGSAQPGAKGVAMRLPLIQSQENPSPSPTRAVFAGYASDFMKGKIPFLSAYWWGDCQILSKPNDFFAGFFFHSCDTGSGASGGAVYHFNSDNQPEWVGITTQTSIRHPNLSSEQGRAILNSGVPSSEFADFIEGLRAAEEKGDLQGFLKKHPNECRFRVASTP